MRTFTTASTVLLMVALCGTARGQNALGDGRGLERQMHTTRDQVTGPTKTQQFQRELAFRESIVTGHAPGGMSFQGNVGYGSRFDFRGETAEDALFGFRRDSVTSSLGPSGIRGVDALQYQFSMTTGGSGRTGFQTGLHGLPYTTRAGELGYNLQMNSRQLLAPSYEFGRDTAEQRADNQQAWDRAGLTLTPMPTNVRSVSGMQASRELEPGFLGYRQQGVGAAPIEYSASPLMGVTGREAPGYTDRQGAAPSTRVEPLRPKSTFYNDLLNELPGGAEQATPDPATDSVEPADPSVSVAEGTDPEVIEPAKSALATRLEELRAVARGEAQTQPTPGGDEPRVSRSVDEFIEQLLAHQEPVDRLVAPPEPEAEFDVFVAEMNAGQTMLTEGRFFEAEERFINALAFEPGDVSALAGRLHAELGAGLLRSAALNLRELILDHPEIMATRYEGAALPLPERLDEVLSIVKSRYSSDNPVIADYAALLSAYIAYQLDRPAEVRDALDRLGAEGGALEPPTVDLLRRLWLGER